MQYFIITTVNLYYTSTYIVKHDVTSNSFVCQLELGTSLSLCEN